MGDGSFDAEYNSEKDVFFVTKNVIINKKKKILKKDESFEKIFDFTKSRSFLIIFTLC